MLSEFPLTNVDILGNLANLLAMRVRYGGGGWAVVDGLDLPGPLYARFRESGGRLRITEIYLDASDNDGGIAPSDLKQIPLSSLETLVNTQDAERVLDRVDEPAPDLSTLASYLGTRFNYELNIERGNWVALSFAAQLSDAERSKYGIDMHVRRQSNPLKGVREVDNDFRLKSGPTEGLTDDFLRDVARAYTAAVARGERPNVEIAKQTGYDVKSAQRWVYTARQRRIMPRGRKGRVG